MEKVTHSPQFLQKRKFFLVLPFLVLPFITLLFWSFGGGKASNAQGLQPSANGGLNINLPDPYFKEDKKLDKLSYYQKAASDSAKLNQLMKNDPNYRQEKSAEINEMLLPSDGIPRTAQKHQNTFGVWDGGYSTGYRSSYFSDSNETKVYRKLKEINTALNDSKVRTDKTSTNVNTARDNSRSVKSADIERLEKMINITKEGEGGDDPEMTQLNGMMEKILDIQHPERVNEKLQQFSSSNRGQVFPVNEKTDSDIISLLINKKNVPHEKFSSNRFYSLDEELKDKTVLGNSIAAVVHEEQEVVQGSIVKFRLLGDVLINGESIPKGQFVFGTASLDGERLTIKINSIRYNNSLYPVDLSVFDLDGIEGIHIPGSITSDVAKQSVDKALQGIGLSALDPSLKVQAANAGIDAAKGLFSKKSKLIKVMVKAGYKVLLSDQKQKGSY